jgi:hypothetical protein
MRIGPAWPSLLALATWSLVVSASAADDYLSWNSAQAEAAARRMILKGAVAGDSWRVMDTHHAKRYNYRVTWLTPEAIRGTARFFQLRDRLTNEEAARMVQEAEDAGDTVFLVELVAVEGSGVIPPDWQAFLQPAGLAPGSPGVARGEDAPELRRVKALAGVLPRDYKFDQFWIVFPLVDPDGAPLISDKVSQVEVIIQIHGKEGTARFPVPDCIRERTAALLREATENAPQTPVRGSLSVGTRGNSSNTKKGTKLDETDICDSVRFGYAVDFRRGLRRRIEIGA